MVTFLKYISNVRRVSIFQGYSSMWLRKSAIIHNVMYVCMDGDKHAFVPNRTAFGQFDRR